MRALLAIAALLVSQSVEAAEIKLMCPAPMRTSIEALTAAFAKASGHTVVITHIPSKTIIGRIEGGEATDIAILTDQATDALIAKGRLARRVDIARSRLGIAVKAGAPKPDLSTPEAVKRTLLAAKSFGRNEGAESGIHVLRVFERLGIADAMKAKTKAMPVGTGYVAQLVASGEVEMAAQQMPELMAVAGVDPTPLPAELQLTIVFTAGVSRNPADAAATEALVKFLSSPAAAPVLRSKGLAAP